jgi:hypothetical protein
VVREVDDVSTRYGLPLDPRNFRRFKCKQARLVARSVAAPHKMNMHRLSPSADACQKDAERYG